MRKLKVGTMCGVVLASVLTVGRGRAQEVRCPQDNRVNPEAMHFKISVGTVTMPIGAVLLVRNGNQLGAVRLTSLTPGPNQAEGRSNYESFSLPNGTTSFTGNGVNRKNGDIYIGETVGVHAVYVHTRGHNKATIGTWEFVFSFPNMLNMSPPSLLKGQHDGGFEFAPTSACQVSEIDATDKRLRWFRWDKTTQVVLPLAQLPK